ncbi:MAG: C4-dicarboxylate ABC transporter permease [Lachnospiraceae bacterium]|nr:C4-dicarboxylate ABC transporter permease [Lachnospiraceae bacterium]
MANKGRSYRRGSLSKVNLKKEALSPMILMMIVLLFCGFLTYIIPAGEFATVTKIKEESEKGEEQEYSVIDPDSFTYLERKPVGALDLLMSLSQGMQRGADVIFYLLIVGGMFAILNGTNALNVGMANLLVRLKKRTWLLIPLLMILFGCGAAFCGNFEEFLVFVPLVLACCITAGYDSLTAVGIIFCAATAGYGGAVTNAFSVGKAQEIAGLPMFSGMDLRLALFSVLLTVAILYICFYAAMIKKNPRLSGAFAYDRAFNQDKRLNLAKIPKLGKRQIAVLLIFVAGMAFSVWGIIEKGFYIDELSGIFLAVGIIGGLVGGLSFNKICKCFEKGCKDMLLPGILIGLANSAVLILENADVMASILHYLMRITEKFPDVLCACGMFLAHEVFNIFVPSASAQANITMPLMVSLADKMQITRQTAVLAYQLGDAFTNILVPTGGEILAALAICRVPYGKWVKFLLPLFIIWYVVAMMFLMFATKTGFGPM